MILDIIVSSTLKECVPADEALRYVLPSITMHFVKLEQLSLLFQVPRLFIYSRIEMIVPAFSALFTSAGSNPIIFFEFAGDFSPVIKTILRHQLTNGFVFLNS